MHRRRQDVLADGSLPGGDRGNQVEPGSGRLRETAEGCQKPFKVVIAVAWKLLVIANSMIRDGTERDPEANWKVSAESAAASCETLVDKAKPDETSKRPEESPGDKTVEPEA